MPIRSTMIVGIGGDILITDTITHLTTITIGDQASIMTWATTTVHIITTTQATTMVTDRFTSHPYAKSLTTTE